MSFIKIDEGNIDGEHICCAISDKKGETCVSSKKAWMRHRFGDGLVFLRLDERCKVFIEYMPGEKAWCPIEAEGYMHINCFWVSGQFKGKGYSNGLLERCIEDSNKKGKSGLSIISSKKKMPFLSDPAHLKYKGFRVADVAEPYYELLYMPFTDNAPVPKFKEWAKKGKIEEEGMVLYYTNQCPHTDKYVPIIKDIAEKSGAAIKVIKIESLEQAKKAPCPFTTYSFFYRGNLFTNEIFSEKKFIKFLDEHEIFRARKQPDN